MDAVVPWRRERGSVLERAARRSGLEDDSAGDAAGGLRAERLSCLCERIHRADLGAQMPLVDQAGELDQLRAAGLLDEVDDDDLPDVVPAGERLGGYRDQRSSGPKERGRPCKHLAADSVKYQVGLAGSVLEAVGVQRDEVVGAQLCDQ
jgi:hypothetical protein